MIVTANHFTAFTVDQASQTYTLSTIPIDRLTDRLTEKVNLDSVYQRVIRKKYIK